MLLRCQVAAGHPRKEGSQKESKWTKLAPKRRVVRKKEIMAIRFMLYLLRCCRCVVVLVLEQDDHVLIRLSVWTVRLLLPMDGLDLRWSGGL